MGNQLHRVSLEHAAASLPESPICACILRIRANQRTEVFVSSLLIGSVHNYVSGLRYQDPEILATCAANTITEYNDLF